MKKVTYEELEQKILTLEKNIAEREKIINTRHEKNELFKALFEQAGGYCMLLQPTDCGIPNILDVNEAACQAHGYSRSEMIGRPVTDLDDEEGKQLCIERTKTIMSGEPLVIETIHVRKDGSTFTVAVFANRVQLAGKPPIIMTTEHDLSEIEEKIAMRTKVLQQALAEIKTLRGIIPVCSYCHSIRNDEGAWDRFEAYLSKNSNAEFSHGICPTCVPKIRAEIGLPDS